ncbi:MAG TPA: hypothetical protein PK109_02355 [Candidatus Paceibacterota bacterium]|nr:hypothetical protein [Candidatus Paceibacterota bacterium]
MNWLLAVPGVAMLVASFVFHRLAKLEEVKLKKLEGKGTLGNATIVEKKRRLHHTVVQLHSWSVGFLFGGILAVAIGPYFFECVDF